MLELKPSQHVHNPGPFQLICEGAERLRAEQLMAEVSNSLAQNRFDGQDIPETSSVDNGPHLECESISKWVE